MHLCSILRSSGCRLFLKWSRPYSWAPPLSFIFVSFILNQFPWLLAALFRRPLFPRIPHTIQFDQQQCQQLSSFVMALNEKPRHFFNDTTRRDVYLSSSNYCSLLLRSFLNNFLIDDDKWVELIFKYRLLQIQSIIYI